jgi:hypothetical protein
MGDTFQDTMDALLASLARREFLEALADDMAQNETLRLQVAGAGLMLTALARHAEQRLAKGRQS